MVGFLTARAHTQVYACTHTQYFFIVTWKASCLGRGPQSRHRPDQKVIAVNAISGQTCSAQWQPCLQPTVPHGNAAWLGETNIHVFTQI